MNEFPLIPYLIALLAGVIAGGVNTLAGSGSLITLPVLMSLGLPPTIANGTNRVGILLQNSVGIITLWRGGKLEIKGWHRFALPTIAGSIVGAVLAGEVDDQVMNWVIVSVMVGMIILVMLKPQRWLRTTLEATEWKWWMVFVFFAIGLYGGFIQAGVGILLLVGLVLVAGYDPVSGNAVKLWLTLIYTMVTLPVFAMNGQIDWGVGVLMALGQGAGAYLAARFAVKSENAGVWIRRMLILVAMASVAKLLFDSLQ